MAMSEHGADCLHCRLMQTMNNYAQGNPQHGEVLLAHLAAVAAEILALCPDRRKRRQMVELFEHHVRRNLAFALEPKTQRSMN